MKQEEKIQRVFQIGSSEKVFLKGDKEARPQVSVTVGGGGPWRPCKNPDSDSACLGGA